MWRLGVGYRDELAEWIHTMDSDIDCLEITAEHFFSRNYATLAALRARFPLVVHGLGLSLGTPGPLDPQRLDQFAAVVAAADPLWISEHVSFTHSGDIDLGHLTPIRRTRQTLHVLTEHIRELRERCGKPVIVENIASHIAFPGEIDEPEFLNELCTAADCGLLVDLTNLAVNAHNHGYDASAWLARLRPEHIVQLHVVGYRTRAGTRHDLHADPIQEEIYSLATQVRASVPSLTAIIERDTNFPPPAELASELFRLRNLDAP